MHVLIGGLHGGGSLVGVLVCVYRILLIAADGEGTVVVLSLIVEWGVGM